MHKFISFIAAVLLSFAAPLSFIAPLAFTTTAQADEASQQNDQNDQDVAQIVQLLKSKFDRPDAPLEAAPVVVEADNAIADWSQSKMGGRALLRRGPKGWSIVLCSGDALKRATFLGDAGVPAADAVQLAAKLADAETHVTPEQLARFSTFDGVVRMGEGTHP